jgi:hypothetical protein
MARYLGRSWRAAELRSHGGDPAQFAALQSVILDDGPERGCRAILMRTGSGLEVELLPDRGLDLGRAFFRGAALAYCAPGGFAHPAFYSARGLDWLRIFGCGLVTTCGLQNVGSPCVEQGREHGLHGGFSATPAREVSARAAWEEEEYVLRVGGTVREVTPMGLFGPNLALRRLIEGRLGSNVLRLRDVVTNEGGCESPLMLLYHCNLGFPLVGEGMRLHLPARKTTPRDAAAAAGLKTWAAMRAPMEGEEPEQVFFHDLAPDEDGWVRVGVEAPRQRAQPPLALELRYRARELPRFIQWKLERAGAYVMGLEPANCSVGSRAKERERGTLQFLKAGESREFALELEVICEQDRLDALRRQWRRSAARLTSSSPPVPTSSAKRPDPKKAAGR